MSITKLQQGQQYVLNENIGESRIFTKGTVVIATKTIEGLSNYQRVDSHLETLDGKRYKGYYSIEARMLTSYEPTSAEDDAGMVLLETGPNAFRKVKRSKMNEVCNQFLRANPYGEVKIWSLNTIARLEMKPIQYISVNDTTALPRPTDDDQEETQEADVIGS